MTIVPQVSQLPVIRLDTSKPYSECRGERTPDDPHYRVHSWQGQKIGNKHVLLPFDSQGLLVPPDPDRMEPYTGLTVEGKQVTHQPLYNKDMLALLDRKMSKLSGASKPQAADVAAIEPDEGEDDAGGEGGNADPADEVNFVSWLRGEAQYEPLLLRAAAKKRYSKNFTSTREMVNDLVLDERVVPEDQVCAVLKQYLPAKVAA